MQSPRKNRFISAKGDARPIFRHPSRWVRTLIVLADIALLWAILVVSVTPIQHDLKAGEIASLTITATKDVEDSLATEQLRQNAMAQVDNVMILDDTVTGSVIARTDAFFTLFSAQRSAYRRQSSLDAVNAGYTADTPMEPSAEILNGAAEAVAEYDMSSLRARTLLMTTNEEYAAFESGIRQIVQMAMEETVQQDGFVETLNRIQLEAVNSTYGIPAALQGLGQWLVGRLIQPNVHSDPAATDAARAAAADAVSPVMYKKGQNIVVAGEMVTDSQIAMLESLGLLKTGSTDITLWAGIAMLSALLWGAFLVLVYCFDRKTFRSPKMLLLLSCIVLLQTAISLLIGDVSPYLLPVQLGTIMIAMLFKPNLAMLLNVPLTIISALLATGDEGLLAAPAFDILLCGQFAGVVSVYVCRQAKQRMSLLAGGLAIGAVQAVSMFAVGLLTNVSLHTTLIQTGLIALSGVLSAILAIAVLPILETVFNLVTVQKLLELSNPNQPLLRRIQNEAPGTYHHSLLVANLAEAAAAKVGANAMLVRVGAYYHDLGKTRRPLYFKENQLDDVNPHDGIEPSVSAAILLAHVRDGRTLGEKGKLPKAVLDFISQHHGSAQMLYFYNKALQQAGGDRDKVNIQDYVYDGPRPQTAETAIVSLADTVEAAVRSMKTHKYEEMEKVVRKLVRERLTDGQLDDAPLTLRDLEDISREFLKVLGGIYHERIEYPNAESVRKEIAE